MGKTGSSFVQYTSFTSQKTTRMKRHPLYESKSISPSSLRLLTSHIQQDHPRFRHHKHHNAHPPRGATSHCNRPEVSKMNPHTGSISKLRCERGHAPNPFRKTTAPFTFYSPVIPVFSIPWINLFCTNAYSTRSGAIEINVAAILYASLILNALPDADAILSNSELNRLSFDGSSSMEFRSSVPVI